MSGILALEGVVAGYGDAVVLPGLSLALEEGRTLAVLGRNGTGKTTLVRTILGLADQRGGTIRLRGQDVGGWTADRRARAGLGWVPQERNIFGSLTVEENLTAVARPGPWSVDRVYGLFPRLRERRRHGGRQLSGGEQQMLAVARALVTNPSLLLLDEPTEGLAPLLVDDVLAVLRRVVREEGLSALIVEQAPGRILPLADDALVLDRGSAVWQGSAAALLADQPALDRHLGVGGSLSLENEAKDTRWA